MNERETRVSLKDTPKRSGKEPVLPEIRLNEKTRSMNL